MSNGTLKHYARLHQARARADKEAYQTLRPDQVTYYRHLLLSWGARIADRAAVLPWLPNNPESLALRKTREQRP